MSKPIIFAVSPQDARALCRERGLIFEDCFFVLNVSLLGTTIDFSESEVYYSDAFRQVPAYLEARAIYPDIDWLRRRPSQN